jgi:DNA-binding MarR family transcriptional regulator
MKSEMKNTRLHGKSVVTLPCACANLRRASRMVTQFYDDALRPSGIRVTQFTLLQALVLMTRTSQKQLAELLGIDSTTLTRTLGYLRRKGWLRTERGADRRELGLSLTLAGRREYLRVLPFWQSAQKRLRRALGKTNWNRLVNAAVNTASVTPRAVTKVF